MSSTFIHPIRAGHHPWGCAQHPYCWRLQSDKLPLRSNGLWFSPPLPPLKDGRHLPA